MMNIYVHVKSPVHILGKNCPRSDPDIVHMGHYLDSHHWLTREVNMLQKE